MLKHPVYLDVSIFLRTFAVGITESPGPTVPPSFSPVKTLEVNKMLKLEEKQIPEDIYYNKVRNIATEARQKFSKIRPLTIGQASRISGVNPSDITMLLVYLKKEYNNE